MKNEDSYEFDSQQNETIQTLAKALQFVGAVSLIFGFVFAFGCIRAMVGAGWPEAITQGMLMIFTLGMGSLMLGLTLSQNECLTLMARHPSSTNALTLQGATLNIWQAGGNASARAKQPVELRQLLWYFSDFNSPASINDSRPPTVVSVVIMIGMNRN